MADLKTSAARPNGHPALFDPARRDRLQQRVICRALAMCLILLLYSRVSKLNLGFKPAFPRFWPARVAG
ncbi:hypothetical protein DWV00_04245 [Trinickia dinghuensis]|uniref:Uncharacterized protein n=1 Tax=Trinickia dinghuensis TaxID=2291023 RepID=A0A3D8K431_9BURK|nr:hypothetical protein DWV00_04245 [Trinickia dinghuensis]